MEAYWLGRHGFQCPEDYACVNLTVRLGDLVQTGALEQQEMTGAIMVDMVVAQLHRDERGTPELAKELLIEAKWNEGAELPPR
jgi:hypothetical protein